MESVFTGVTLSPIGTLHPLLDPFAQSRDAAVRACMVHLRRSYPLGARLAGRWPGGIGESLGVLFAWFETARELEREEAPFVRERGLELLRGTLDDSVVGGPGSRNALGLALPSVLAAAGASPLALLGTLEARERGLATGAFASRTELVNHAAQLTHAEAHAYLGLLGKSSERAKLEAQALAEGLQLVRWLTEAQNELRRGRLRFAADDVARFRVEIGALERGEATTEIARLGAAHAEWAGGLLVKGWGLCQTLGWARGRALAAFLRWNVASLAALEEKDFRPGKAPKGGWMRRFACGMTALATRRPAGW